jgi:hypothetical protein
LRFSYLELLDDFSSNVLTVMNNSSSKAEDLLSYASVLMGLAHKGAHGVRGEGSLDRFKPTYISNKIET